MDASLWPGRDALSYLNLFAVPDPLTWLPFVVLGLLLALAVIAGGRGRLTFFLGTGLCLIVCFALSKQAFANYYLVVITSLCLAVDASQDPHTASRVP